MAKRWSLLQAGAVMIAAALAACSPGPRGPAAVDEARLMQAASEPSQWMTHGGSYHEQRFSQLTQVSTQNVSELGLAWSYEFLVGRAASATPLVVDGVMYVTSAWSIVYALNAATGEELWIYDPEVPRERGQYACCDVVNRGVAVWDGRVYVGTIDGRLVAIDAETGEEVWDVITVDQARPYTITGAPRAAGGLIYIGNGGAEYGVRGFVSAYDAETGELAWRFYTTPNPDGPDGAASDSVRDWALATWNPDGAWRQSGGGGTAWDAIVYDPENNALWIGVGNGSPWNQQVRAPRRGGEANDDNLFVTSIVKLDATTGEYQCHYQANPGDTWDYTATQPIMLAELEIEGQTRQVAMQAPKNGFFYVLDRSDCALISATPLIPMAPESQTPPGAPVSWSTGQVDAAGRPIENPSARFESATALVRPSSFGVHNWHPWSMSPQTGLVYIPIQDSAMDFTTDPAFAYREGRWNTGTVHAALPMGDQVREMIGNSLTGALIAWDPVNRREAWRAPLNGAWNGGTLATAGGLVFQGTVDGHFIAYDAASGAELWRYGTQAATLAGPISYEVDGVQYVAVNAGYGTVFFLNAGFAAPTEGNALNSRVVVFRLGGTASLPALDLTPLPMAAPPVIRANAQTMAAGQNLYNVHCAVCHGAGAVTGGVLPDVRRSTTLQSAEQWLAVVHGGRTAQGMPDFTQWVTAQEAEAMRAYVAAEAQGLYAAQQNPPQ